MNHKDIIDLIQKTAYPKRSGAKAPRPAAKPGGGAPSRTSGSPQSYSGGAMSSSVRDMQTEIKNFATEVANYSSDMRGRTPAADQLDGRKSFNDFITEQYLAGAEVKGVEWSKDPTRVTREQKKEHETNLTEMDIVMDSLSRIGNSKTEFKIDGVWGFRTNNALLNIYAFAVALVKLSEDFGDNSSGIFGRNQLKEMFSNLIKDGDPNKVPSSEKNKKAEVLAELIKKLTAFYQRYVKKIAENPYYKRYIDGSAMFTVNPNKVDPAHKTPEEQDMLKHPENIKIGPLTLSGPNKAAPHSVSLSHLISSKTLRQLAEGLGYSSNVALNLDIQNKILGEIEAHVQSMLSQQNKSPMQMATPPPMQIAAPPSK